MKILFSLSLVLICITSGMSQVRDTLKVYSVNFSPQNKVTAIDSSTIVFDEYLKPVYFKLTDSIFNTGIFSYDDIGLLNGFWLNYKGDTTYTLKTKINELGERISLEHKPKNYVLFIELNNDVKSINFGEYQITKMGSLFSLKLPKKLDVSNFKLLQLIQSNNDILLMAHSDTLFSKHESLNKTQEVYFSYFNNKIVSKEYYEFENGKLTREDYYSYNSLDNELYKFSQTDYLYGVNNDLKIRVWTINDTALINLMEYKNDTLIFYERSFNHQNEIIKKVVKSDYVVKTMYYLNGNIYNEHIEEYDINKRQLSFKNIRNSEIVLSYLWDYNKENLISLVITRNLEIASFSIEYVGSKIKSKVKYFTTGGREQVDYQWIH